MTGSVRSQDTAAFTGMMSRMRRKAGFGGHMKCSLSAPATGVCLGKAIKLPPYDSCHSRSLYLNNGNTPYSWD